VGRLGVLGGPDEAHVYCRGLTSAAEAAKDVVQELERGRPQGSPCLYGVAVNANYFFVGTPKAIGDAADPRFCVAPELERLSAFEDPPYAGDPDHGKQHTAMGLLLGPMIPAIFLALEGNTIGTGIIGWDKVLWPLTLEEQQRKEKQQAVAMYFHSDDWIRSNWGPSPKFLGADRGPGGWWCGLAGRMGEQM